MQSALMQSVISIVRFFAIWIGLWLPIAIPIALKLKWRPPQPLTLAQKLPLLASLYAIAPIVLWGFAGWSNPPFAVYGLPWLGSVLAARGRGTCCRRWVGFLL
ncbi:MAG: hypothetical protein HC895_26155, partial [Leptolyngbyaceae cyanobacterium SM1_3_5]|nr:hypothetical protein [Leptolyngbyaceae cyanobacterium SM1_3_5]